MLPSPTLPATWRGLLEMFRPAFRRSRTFGLFVLLATGLVAQTARRTVVGMLVGAGVAAVVSFHGCCRFFSQHRWDVDRIGLVLARDRGSAAGCGCADRRGGRLIPTPGLSRKSAQLVWRSLAREADRRSLGQSVSA
ncbi:MAG TPA: hypothetical protein VFP27_08065 [Mycobacterium sp.]|nr:hypothetical protein [Mycobacterium sp.]